jgi:hypothetical protein
MKAAKSGFGKFIDDAIVLNGGFPAHPPDHADGFHTTSRYKNCYK